jgi:hypothetical protein
VESANSLGTEDAVLMGEDGKLGALYLCNVHVGNLMDTRNAWPTRGQLHLDGFTFDHLGGFREGGMERDGGIDWWDKNWARLDPEYSPVPYSQLAAVLTASGYRDEANEIRYLGRNREREAAWQRREWCAWFFRTALCYVVGYGIGLHTFRVLYWVLGFSLAGAALLWSTVPAARTEHRGPIWCFGASLTRLLPVIEINKEFTEFFNDPDRKRFDVGANNTRATRILNVRLISWRSSFRTDELSSISFLRFISHRDYNSPYRLHPRVRIGHSP